MTLYITAIDEPIYLVPYLRAVIQSCQASVVGVAEVASTRSRPSWRRLLALALLGALMFSPRQWLQLAAYRLREIVAALGIGRTRHRLGDLCRELGIPFRRIESANDPAFVAHLREVGVDVLLNQASERLHAPLLSAPRIAVINRHLSILPAYRGAWPIFWQFANRENRVGVTIHIVDRGLDSGPIAAQHAVDRDPAATMAQTTARLFAAAVPLTCEALRRLERGERGIANETERTPTYKTPLPGDVVRYLLGMRVHART